MIDEHAVYNNYRAALRAQYGGHAAQRRQTARALTVERYNIPFAEVKDIVAKWDAANNITHEQPADYLERLEFDLARKAFEENPTACQCGNTEDVDVRVDPFEWEIHGVFKWRVMCLDVCYRLLLEEI